MKLNGIYRFLSEGHDWEIDFIRSESAFTVETFRTAARGDYHGLFIGWKETPEMQTLHAELARSARRRSTTSRSARTRGPGFPASPSISRIWATARRASCTR